MKGFKEKCLEAGYSDYLSKPINIDQFMEMMSQLLGGRKVEEEQPFPSRFPKAWKGVTQRTTRPWRTARLSPDCRQEMKNSRGSSCGLWKNWGAQLEALEAASTRDDLVEVANLAHWLKGAGGTVGFDVFTEPAAQLETDAKLGNTDRIQANIATLRALAARVKAPGASPGMATGQMPAGDTVSSPAPGSAVSKPVVSRLANNLRFQPTILKFIEKLDEKVNQMQSALDTENLTELGNLAHWLKGAGGTVGYDDFTQPANDLENYAKTLQVEQAARMLEQVKSLSRAIVPPVISGKKTEETVPSHTQP